MKVSEMIERLQAFPPDAEALLHRPETETTHADDAPIFDLQLDRNYVVPCVVIT